MKTLMGCEEGQSDVNISSIRPLLPYSAPSQKPKQHICDQCEKCYATIKVNSLWVCHKCIKKYWQAK